MLAEKFEDASLFERVELVGLLYNKHDVYVWIVLFTCGIRKATHLEMITSLVTETLLISLRRFIARRIHPRVMYTDSGTNYQSVFNKLCILDWFEINRENSLQHIFEKFN